MVVLTTLCFSKCLLRPWLIWSWQFLPCSLETVLECIRLNSHKLGRNGQIVATTLRPEIWKCKSSNLRQAQMESWYPGVQLLYPVCCRVSNILDPLLPPAPLSPFFSPKLALQFTQEICSTGERIASTVTPFRLLGGGYAQPVFRPVALGECTSFGPKCLEWSFAILLASLP